MGRSRDTSNKNDKRGRAGHKNTTGTRHHLSFGLTTLAAAFLIGCQSMPAQQPHTAMPQAAALKQSAPWWQEAKDPVLDELLHEAVQRNVDVRRALTQLRQAEALSGASHSALFPSVGLAGAAVKSQSTLPEFVKRNRADTEALQLSAELEWQLDVFGALRAKRRAAQSQTKAAGYAVHASKLAVSEALATQYYQWQAASAKEQVLSKLLQNLKDTQVLTQALVNEGMAGTQVLKPVAAQTLATQAALKQIRALKRMSQSRIAVLLGQSPVSFQIQLVELTPAQWPKLGSSPVELDPALLLRRPDVLAAQMQLEASAFELSEAKALQFPQFFASAVYGTEDLTINGLDIRQANFSNLALSFAMPLINRGQIKANIRAKTAQEQSALIDYEARLLGALEDTDTALAAAKADSVRTGQLSLALTSRISAYEHAKTVYEAGESSRFEVRESEREALSAELELIDAAQAAATNWVRLHVALGGSWQQFDAAKGPVLKPNMTNQESVQTLLKSFEVLNSPHYQQQDPFESTAPAGASTEPRIP